MSDGVCAACRRSIDAAAKLCPYCGANPATGERFDTQAILQEVFQGKSLTRTENVLEYARQRQGIVIGISVAVVFVLLALLHQFVTARNDRSVSDAPPVPLTEIADIANQTGDATPAPLPPLDFQYGGRPEAMRTLIVEPGAIAPQPAQPAAPAQQPPPARPPQPQPR